VEEEAGGMQLMLGGLASFLLSGVFVLQGTVTGVRARDAAESANENNGCGVHLP